jgi:Ca-activated chloride channel homolog
VAGGPLLLAGETGGRQIAILTFDLRQSDLPLKITWPVLMANLMEWFTPGSILTTAESYTVGDAVLIRPSLEAELVRVGRPDGSTTDLRVERSTLIYTDTTMPGIYRLEVVGAGNESLRTQLFAVNLFTPQESDIAPRSIQVGGQTVSGDAREEQGQREFWTVIALLALLVLLIEWYAYHRRLQIPTLMGGRRVSRTVPAGVR